MVHPILGAIELSASGFWDATVTFGGRPVTIGLTIDGAHVAAADVDDLRQKPEDLVPLDRAARLAILRDAQSGDEDSAAALNHLLCVSFDLSRQPIAVDLESRGILPFESCAQARVAPVSRRLASVRDRGISS